MNNITIFHLKIIIFFTAVKNRRILHGRVIVINNTYQVLFMDSLRSVTARFPRCKINRINYVHDIHTFVEMQEFQPRISTKNRFYALLRSPKQMYKLKSRLTKYLETIC